MTTFAAEIRDPVHGYIYASEVEREVIDTPVFQRMRRIRQLSGAHLAYPGAQHTRFEHMIGVMHLADLAGRVLASKTGLGADEVQELRLAALVHDIGHGPFSHLFEEVMTEKTGVTHEDMAKRILRETELSDIVGKHGFRADILSECAVGLSPHKPPYINDVIGGGLSVDIMDYLLRDSYFTGVEYGRVDAHRLINSFEVVNGQLALDQAAQYAFEALMIARYEMFKAVYFHRTVRAAEVMLIKALELAGEHLRLTDIGDLDHYLSLTDEALLDRLIGMDTSKSEELKQARDLAVRYRDRRLFKCVFERLLHRRDRFIETIFSQKRVREQLAAEIAAEAGVDPDFICIDVPTAPSVPFTSSRQALTEITFVARSREDTGARTVMLSDIPVVGAISGFMDILRVYTTAEHRDRVEKAVGRFLGREGYSSKVSM